MNLTSLVRNATACLYLLRFHECSYSFATVQSSLGLKEIPIIFSEILEIVRLIEIDEQNAFLQFASVVLHRTVALGRFAEIRGFFSYLLTIPNISLYRLGLVAFLFMDRTIRLIFGHATQGHDKVIEMFSTFGSYVIHRLRLTPGAITPHFLRIFEGLTDCLITYATSGGGINSWIVSLLISAFHLDLSQEFVARIKASLVEITRMSRPIGYFDLVERMDNPFLAPCRYETAFDERLFEQEWESKSESDRFALFSLCCKSIHCQTKVLLSSKSVNNDSDYVIDLWKDIFHSLHFPGSGIFEKCPMKWMISSNCLSYQQRSILQPMNPAIDRPYAEFWTIKYGGSPPEIRLTIQEVLKFTSVSFHNAEDLRFSSHACRNVGIVTYEGILVVSDTSMRFYHQDFDNSLSLQILKLHSVRLKLYKHQPTGIEINCNDSSCYLFSFYTASCRDRFVEVLSGLGVKIIPQLDTKDLDLNRKKWVEGSLSNFEYLLYLSSISGRSFNDFTQYPIMPWILTNYTSPTLDVLDHRNYRDLKYPIFAQTEAQRVQCSAYHRMTTAMKAGAHCVTNYISNVSSVLYYLVRIEPITTEEIRFQGGTFDAPERTCWNLAVCYDLMTAPTNRNSLELIPDFYFSPEVFKNVNSVRFPSSRQQFGVDEVVLPPWAASHRHLIKIMRDALESSIVSSNLNDFIDLIWGFRRRGEPALEFFNVYLSTVFEFDPHVALDDRILFQAMSDQIRNCGQATQQLFRSEHPRRQTGVRRRLRGSLTVLPSRRKSEPISEWLSLADSGCFVKEVRLTQGAVEARLRQSSSIFGLLKCADDIAVTCIDALGRTLVTGHVAPVTVLWRLNEGIEFVAELRGHIAPVTAIALFAAPWSLVAVGHDDGAVSLFSRTPARLLRILVSENPARVTLLRMASANGDILVVQKDFVTLWAVNGEKVSCLHMEKPIVDTIVTQFAEGVSENFVFVLCANGTIYTFRAFDMEILGEVKVTKGEPVQLNLTKEGAVLVVRCADGTAVMYGIE
jgi:hypothetical protein